MVPVTLTVKVLKLKVYILRVAPVGLTMDSARKAKTHSKGA